MKRPILILATAAVLLASAPTDFAAPFDSKDVAASPALLFHVDCDALRASSVGQSILSEPEVRNKLEAVGAIFDFDISKQLHGLTVYTTEAHPKDGVLIVYADFDPNRLITMAKGADGFESATHGSHVIYSWLDDKKKTKGGQRPRVCGAILGHRVIFGQNSSHLAEALEVMDGSAPALSSNKSLPAPDPGESILAQGEVLKFDFDSDDQKAAIFKMSKSARVKLSEVVNTHDHLVQSISAPSSFYAVPVTNMTATVRLEAADADTATQIASIAQGLLALLRLQKSDANALKLANAIVIKQDGPAVGLTLSEPSSELIHMIKEGQKKAEQQEQDAKSDEKSPPENK